MKSYSLVVIFATHITLIPCTLGIFRIYFPVEDSYGLNDTEVDVTYRPTNSSFNSSYNEETNHAFLNSSLVSFRKCCSPNEVLIKDTNVSTGVLYSCQSIGNLKWVPTLYTEPEVQFEPQDNASIDIRFKSEGFPNCTYTLLDNRLDFWFNLLTDGSVAVGLNFWTIPLWLRPIDEEYCVDATYNDSDVEVLDINNPSNYVLAFCELEGFQLYLRLRLAFGCLFMISATALLVTIIVYIMIWDHHSVHGWTQFAFFLSFLLFYILEGSRIFAKLNGLNIKPTRYCFIHAMISHYCTVVISGSSCMMSLDCFVTFWKLQSTRNRSKGGLAFYMLLAWGIPVIALSAGLYSHIQNNPEKAAKAMSGVFEYAHYRCSSPVWEFAYRVQMVMLLVNFMAFLGTAYLIIKHFKSTAMAHPAANGVDRRRRQFKKSSLLFLKLFLIMGVSTILNVVDLIFGKKNPTRWYFVILRACLTLQGLIFLFIFGLHRKNFQLLKKKYPNVSIFAILSKSTDQSNRNLPQSTGSNTNTTIKFGSIRKGFTNVASRIRSASVSKSTS